MPRVQEGAHQSWARYLVPRVQVCAAVVGSITDADKEGEIGVKGGGKSSAFEDER